jgi:26S proteasome regulatory subunit N5
MTATQEKPTTTPKKNKKGDDKTREEKINEIIAEGGTIVKMEVDHSAACDEKLPIAESLAEAGKLNEALDMLLALEKLTRTGSDTHSSGRILVLIVKLCAKAGEWNMLNEKILELTKKRSQLKMAVAKMVGECCSFLDTTPDKPTMLKLIDTLRTVTTGKIYVENERARLTHRLAKIKEEEGELQEAAKLMQDLQVETYGSMERKEKVELILEIMRLCLVTHDYIRTQIISKKISTRFFEDGKQDELKLKFYQYMIEQSLHDQDYLGICKHYRAVYNTGSIQAEEEKKLTAMKNVVLYVVLAKYDNEQSDLIHRIEKEKILQDLPRYKQVVEKFTTMELINQAGFCQQFEKELRDGVEGNQPTGVFPRTEEGDARWKDLFSRIVEHNIRIMAKYYTRISLTRMAELLALPESKAEDSLSDMVVSGAVAAKTDRLEGVIDFTQQSDPLENLNEWSSNTNKLMDLVMKTTHLINKEEMVNKHLLSGGQTAE